MDHRNNKYNDPWDDGVYGTGNTMPPKNHSGIITLLLVLVIFLSGIISFLSFLNIKLFQELKERNKQNQQLAPMSFSDMETNAYPPLDATKAPEQHIQGDVSIHLNKSPQSVENVPQEGALSWQEIYEMSIPSVVSVLSTGKTGSAAGSGIIVSESGFIVTTACLVSDVQTITVTLHDGRTCDAQVVGADPVTDLAVIFVEADGLQPAQFGDSDALRVGDAVCAIGDYSGVQLESSLIPGMISAINRDVRFLGKDITLIQSDVALNSGNSGSPLVNCYGQVIGINTTHISPGEPSDRIGFAIPSTTVKQIVDQLIAHGYVSGRPTLGLSGESVTRFDQYYFQIPQGLYLSQVEPGSDAYVQNIEPGDILMSLNGEPITDQLQLNILVNSLSIGDSVTAVFYREGKEETITLTVTEYVG